MDIVELTEKVRKYAYSHLDPMRYDHSLRTGDYAAYLAARYGVDEQKARFAGVAHDICKNEKGSRLFSLAAKDGLPIGKLERDKPSLLHGRAAAIVLRDEFALDDGDIIEAVRYHTFGKANASDLTLVIYIADKIEPGRKNADKLRELAKTAALPRLAADCAEECLRIQRRKRRPIAPDTRLMIDWLTRN